MERREELDRDDWRIVVVLAKGIYREPERTLERVVDGDGESRHTSARSRRTSGGCTSDGEGSRGDPCHGMPRFDLRSRTSAVDPCHLGVVMVGAVTGLTR